MTAAARWLPLLFSLGIHSLLLGGILFLSNETPDNTERVFRVALAEFAPALTPPPLATVEPPAPVPPPPPEPKQPEVQPKKLEAPKPNVKKISPKKSDKPVPKDQAATPPPPPSAPTGPQPRTIGGLSVYERDVLDQRPSITRRVEPEYPTRARRMNVQGSVNIRLIVDSSGQPRNCEIVRATPSGYFEESALKAAQSMRFAPGKLKGQPVNTLVELPFIFKLR